MFEFFKKKKQVESKHQIAKLSPDDDTLKTYQEEAQEALPYLIEFMGSHAKDDDLFRYTVKAKFTENDHGEHMWVQVNEFKDGYFIGMLANEPSTIKLLKYGDAVNVLRENVEDWIL